MITRPDKTQLKQWLANPGPQSDLKTQIIQSPTTPLYLEMVRNEVPDVSTIPTLPYTVYREFEHSGLRDTYEALYYHKRAQLTRALLEYLMGDSSMLAPIQNLLWSICEETTWVLPAHEEQGPDYWEIDPPYIRTESFGAHTMLTREPDSIDLFAAETGALLAEVVHLIGDDLAPEVRQRVRQEVERHIFKPYLARARDHWWFLGELNWNGVCNGAIGLAFLRLENDRDTLADALALVLEGFETYIARGFEADGGSIEGVGYWNYGLMYYIVVAEILRETTRGELDLLAQPRLQQIAAYPPGMTLSAPDQFINFGDAPITQELSSGVVNHLAQRTGVDALRGLFVTQTAVHDHALSKLPIICRHVAWWDATQPLPAFENRDFYQPASGVIKFVGHMQDGRQVVLATKSGHNDGHHSHADIGTFIIHVAGESLLPDLGRGHYSKQYFRRERYANPFNNSYGHSVPRIDGQLQKPGPEFGGNQRYRGEIVAHGERDGVRYTRITFDTAYDLANLMEAVRELTLNAAAGEVTLTDVFTFSDGKAPTIEEAFVTWYPVIAEGNSATIQGEKSTLTLIVLEPAGVTFTVESLEQACKENHFSRGTAYRLAAVLPPDSSSFRMTITVQ